MTTAATAATVKDGTEESPTLRTIRKVLSYALLFGLALTFLYPFIYAIFSSFKPLNEIAQNPATLLPQEWTLDAYRRLLNYNFPRWLFNSAFIAVIVTLATVLLASMAGYALARIKFRGANLIFTGLIGTMMVPGIVLLIPMFIILKFLGLVDTYGGLIFPKLVTVYGIFLMTQFYKAIPIELEEAALIDGANRWQIFSRVVLPLTRPAIVALVIATFQGS